MQDKPNDDVPNDKLVGPDPLEDSLEDARKIIEKWEKAMADNPQRLLFLNEAQCTQMWQNFRRVYDAFEPSSSYHPYFKRKCLHVFLDFHNIVERGGTVMEMCSKSESWLEAAILFGDNERMFQELSENLQFCVDCASELTKSLSFTFPSHKPLNHVKVAILPDQAYVDFEKDFARLNANLKNLVNQLRSGQDEMHLADKMHLAQYLLNRQYFMSTCDSEFRAESSRQTVLRSQDPSASVANPSEFFFEVNRHYPTGGDKFKSGGGGDVKVCTVDWLGLKCAKKEFDASDFYDYDEGLKKYMINFEKEVSALQGLNHRNIVRHLCSQKRMPKPSFLMEFVEMNLLEYLNKRKKRPINIIAAVDMMLQIGLGMEYLHGQAVVHRDLKSPNILVSLSRHPSLQTMGYVEVKLTDFGLAKVNVTHAVSPTYKYKQTGTTRWVAPEARKPSEGDRIDWRLADTYSFAMTCSEILTLELPPRGRERPVLPRECPDYLREFLEKCWAENPKNRPYFKEIVSTLKEFKRHLLQGTVPERVPSADLFNTRLFCLGMNFWLQNFKTRDLSALMVDKLDHVDWLNEAELEHFKATVASIEKRLKLAQLVFDSMNERRREVIVCPTQCSHLVDECKKGLEQVTLSYLNLDPAIIVYLFRSQDKKLQGLVRSLNGLISSLMAAEELVGSCCGPHQWKILALALCAPLCLRRARSRFGYCLWELYWSLHVTRSHLEATHSSAEGPLLLTSLRFKWSNESRKFVLVADVSGVRDAEIEHLEGDGEEEFGRADEERQIQDRKLLLSSVQNSTLEEPPINYWHVISTYLESVCASIWKVPTTKFDSNSLPPELGALLMRRLESKSLELVHEPGSRSSQTSAVAFYDLNDEKLDCNSPVPFSTFEGEWYECWGWGVKMLLFKKFLFRGDARFEHIKEFVRLQHPNIVNFIGFQEKFQSELFERKDNSWFEVFEPMPISLEKLIWSNTAFYSGSIPFSFPVTLDILLQIVEAMIHVHQCGVVYLDLNPWNIFVQPKYRYDRFGTTDLDLQLYYTVKLARSEHGILVNPTGPLGLDDFFDGLRYCGIEDYNAPELHERCKLTKFVDVWSFGMTVYHIVSGSCPFESMNSWITMEHLKEVYRGESQLSLPFGATFPKGLKALIQKCCVVDPYARISFEEIRQELWMLRKNFDIDGLQE